MQQLCNNECPCDALHLWKLIFQLENSKVLFICGVVLVLSVYSEFLLLCPPPYNVLYAFVSTG